MYYVCIVYISVYMRVYMCIYVYVLLCIYTEISHVNRAVNVVYG